MLVTGETEDNWFLFWEGGREWIGTVRTGLSCSVSLIDVCKTFLNTDVLMPQST